MNAASQPSPTHTKHRLIQGNARHEYEVTEADLPLCCPMPGMYLWKA